MGKGARTRLGFGVLLACGLALGGCDTYADSLGRARRAFEQSEHERTLAILRALEPDVRRLSTPDRARYAYLRGMTDFRIGYRLEARHWLSLASASERETPGSLPADWAARMKDSLKELDEVVYTSGIASLSNSPGAPPAVAPSSTADDDTGAADPPAASKPAAADE